VWVAHDLGMLEALGAGLLQGVAFVFPISGLGHGVIIGSIASGAGADIAPANAGYLYACLQLGIGVALFAYFRQDWLHILTELARTFVSRQGGPQRRWAWLSLLAAVPGCVAVWIVTPYAKRLLPHPLIAALCLIGNGVAMLAVWWWWRRLPRAGGMSGTHRAPMTRAEEAEALAVELSVVPAYRVLILGLLPVASVVPGVSGVGLTFGAGLLWGLSHEQAARGTLLLGTPVLLTWAIRNLLTVPSSDYDGIKLQVIVSGVAAVVAAYLAAALLVRYFRSASLRPFGYYCVLAGGLSLYALSR
jgi:undecaprenyl-diphosphatase